MLLYDCEFRFHFPSIDVEFESSVEQAKINKAESNNSFFIIYVLNKYKQKDKMMWYNFGT